MTDSQVMGRSAPGAALVQPSADAKQLASGIPLFDGRADKFADFVYKAKAVFLELGVDDSLLRSVDNINEVITRRERLTAAVQAAQRGQSASSSSSSSSSQHVSGNTRSATQSASQSSSESVEQMMSELATINRHSQLIARVVITRLSSSVTDRLRRALPENQHFDGLAIWRYLHQTYAGSAVIQVAANNAERALLDILTRLQWNKQSPLSAYLRHVKSKLDLVLLSKRIQASDISVTNFITSLVIRDVLVTA